MKAKRFEYLKVPARHIVDVKNPLSIHQPSLNMFGKDGWELVCFTWWNGKLAFGYFKREVK